MVAYVRGVEYLGRRAELFKGCAVVDYLDEYFILEIFRARFCISRRRVIKARSRQITRPGALATLPMAASAAANAAAPRKKRVQGPWMCQVEQLAVLRSGIAVSISSGESTMEKLEKNMGDQWPQQLERATQEHGWSEKNLKKKFGSEPWTIATAKSARVELKRLWPQYLALKAWCLNVANPQFFLQNITRLY